VSEPPAQAVPNEIECPHCHRSFQAELLEGPAARYNGFKCPHCRLFIPLERVEEQEPAPSAD
jgi:hypothetical protein